MRPLPLELALATTALLFAGACTRDEKRAVPEDAGATLSALPEPRHGGQVERTSFGAAELVDGEDGALSLYLRAPNGAELPAVGTTASLRVALQDLPELPFAAEGNRFFVKVPGGSERGTVVVILKREGKTELVRFSGSSAQLQHHQAARKSREPGLDELLVHVTDSTCLLRGEDKSHDHRQCAIRCINGGAAIALVEKGSGSIHVALAPPGQSVKDLLLPHVGSDLMVRGHKRTQGGSQFFEVREVFPSHDHASIFGGAVGMAGDLHIEVLALRAGEVRVYLSDDFRRPVDVRGVKGETEVRAGKGELVIAKLQPETSGRYLVGKVKPLPAEPAEVTARLELGELGTKYGVPGAGIEDYFMTFVVDPLDSSAEPPTRTQGKGGAPEVLIEVQGGYSPSSIRLPKGVSTKLRFFRKDSGECSREVLIPELGIRAELAPLGETVVEVRPEKAGKYAFSCGMKMLKGELVVE
ncbi:MAG: cupredoxin domain-containing protein [Myxococcales bacterium]|nr:cupredoxin domain-containing protein [Myxococcales bacterium]